MILNFRVIAHLSTELALILHGGLYSSANSITFFAFVSILKYRDLIADSVKDDPTLMAENMGVKW
jgi:hypothetical protein